MKFMKLGSKPDQFQNGGDTIRYVATDLASDMVVNVGDIKFFLHKFPLLSKSSHLQKLVANTNNETNDEINIHEIPGGPAAFEICVKFCYGMVVTLNAYNVVAARCASEYLEMYETTEKGNLIYKIDVFLTSSLFRSWKDSIIVLQTTKSLLPWSEELKIVSHCLDSVATKASSDPSEVNWSYTYNRKKLSSENGNDPLWRKNQTVPKDWWVEDLCELQIDLYKRVITTIKAKESMSNDVIGESLRAYSLRRLPGFSRGSIQGNDLMKYRYVVDTITWLLPNEKNCVPCGFLLKLLYGSIMLDCGETGKKALMRKIAQQLEEAIVTDFMIRSSTGETGIYSIDIMHKLVELFVIQENSACNNVSEFPEICTELTLDDSKIKVARLVDSYLAEASRDSCLSLSSFVDLAEMVSSFPRFNHDGIYRAIDMFLKEHPGLSKNEKKRICRLMECRKLSAEACGHAVQNERLPMRIVVQVLFFEQARAGDNISSSVKTDLLHGRSYGSSRSTTTNTDEDYDGDHMTSEELKALKRELASLRLRKNACETNDSKLVAEKVTAKKVKKIFSRIWSKNDRQGVNSSSSDTSASNSAEEIRSTPSRSRKQS